jgi:anti-anti-sigma factor
MTEIQVEFARREKILVARLSGELDFSNTKDTEAQIRESMTNDMIGLAVDLSVIRYIDSGGVKMLFDLVQNVEACRQGIGIILGSESPVRRLVEVTNLDDVATVFASTDECVAQLQGSEDLI